MSGIQFSWSSPPAITPPKWISARARTETIVARPATRATRRLFPATHMAVQNKHFVCLDADRACRSPDADPADAPFDPHVYWTCRPRPRPRPRDWCSRPSSSALDRGEERRAVRRCGGGGEGEPCRDRYVALDKTRRYSQWTPYRGDARIPVPDGAQNIARAIARRPAITNIF